MATINVKLTIKAWLLCFSMLLVSSSWAETKLSPTVVIFGESKLATKYIDLLKEKTGLYFNVVDLNRTKSIINIHPPFIVVGSKALDSILEINSTLPIISTLVSRVDFYHSLQQYKTSENSDNYFANITAIYSDPDLFLQFKLMAEFFTAPTASMLISEKSSFMKPQLLTAANKAGVKLSFTPFNYQTDNIDKVISSIRHSDILFAMPDRDVWNLRTIKNILISSYRQDQAVFGFSRKMVKVGSLATVYTDIDDISEETVTMLISYQKTGKLPEKKYPSEFDISVNKNVALSFGKAHDETKLISTIKEGG